MKNNEIAISEKCFTCANKNNCHRDKELRELKILAFNCYVQNKNTHVGIEDELLDSFQPIIETEEKTPCSICSNKQSCPFAETELRKIYSKVFNCYESINSLQIDKHLLIKNSNHN